MANDDLGDDDAAKSEREAAALEYDVTRLTTTTTKYSTAYSLNKSSRADTLDINAKKKKEKTLDKKQVRETRHLHLRAYTRKHRKLAMCSRG